MIPNFDKPFIYPYLAYGCFFWGNTYAAPLTEIVRLQSKAIRIIIYYYKWCSASGANSTPLCAIRSLEISRYCKTQYFPISLWSCIWWQVFCVNFISFYFVSEQHHYATRSSQLQHLSFHFYQINIRKFCPTIIGKYHWNNIPLSIRLKSSKHSSRQSLFCYYFAQYWLSW